MDSESKGEFHLAVSVVDGILTLCSAQEQSVCLAPQTIETPRQRKRSINIEWLLALPFIHQP